jgi:hypothetical protein
MVSERITEEKQTKVVRQTEIKMSVLNTFHLNAVLKTVKQMCEKREFKCVA